MTNPGMDVKIPEPFRAALGRGEPADVCDAEASTPEALYGRATARLQVGRDRDARSDLEAAMPALGDVCLVELMYLKLRERADLTETLEGCRALLERAPEGTRLRARACHIFGLLQGKVRNTAEATKYLVEASGAYRRLGDRAGWAQVQDTLGSLEASLGRVDLALSAYALSLVEKTLCADRYGTAITLGNLGRVHLRLGRFRDALDCFEMNYRIASEMGDSRGCARMLEDIGRAHIGLEEFEKAGSHLCRCLAIAREKGYKDLEFFAHKDLAEVWAKSGQLDDAQRELAMAERVFGEDCEPYLKLLLEAARGRLELARGDDGALEQLETAARKFGEFSIPDDEIALRITLARAYAERKLKQMAEACLNRALERARLEGYERFLRPIREAMVELGSTAGLACERDRLSGFGDAEVSPGGYTLFECLGRGGFGKVYRAYDPRRDLIVAIKRIRMGKVYDPTRREELLTSARLELEAASRIRHPGVGRVFAVGEDRGGGIYVVQEFVKGRSLRDELDLGTAADTWSVLEKIHLIAGALDALHRHGIVHRDLKPGNIILRDPDASPVLVDFGVAWVAGYEGGFDTDTVVGTLAYMPPERWSGEVADSKGDLYSLGVLCYEWLKGGLPEGIAGSTGEKRSRAFFEAIRFSLRDDPPLESGIVELLESLLDPEPQRRADASAVAERCEELMGESAFWADTKMFLTDGSRTTRSLDSRFGDMA